jgi:hypothetical protein
MPLELGVWRIDGATQRVEPARLDLESRLEDIIHSNVELIGAHLWFIGRQVQTSHGHRVDLLAMDREGNLVVIELKRDRTPREVVAQLLDYGSWIRTLGADQVGEIYRKYRETYASNAPDTVESAFLQRFPGATYPESIDGKSHQLVVVAAELDASTERIINYLIEFNVPVNAVFFRVFRDGEREYLTRAWLRDPFEVEARTEESQATQRGRESWDGDSYYVAYGGRDWEEARQFGFVSAGGGAWYTRTLRRLVPGARVFVHIPSKGYVGVGVVLEEAVPATEFGVPTATGAVVPLRDVAKRSTRIFEETDPEKVEYAVRVQWLRTVPEAEAYWEDNFFANQNSACKLRNRHTIERVKQHFGIQDSP